MQPLSPITDTLRRQHLRRRQGVPTITTFLGPSGLAVRAWREWLAEESRPCLVAFGTERNALIRQWVETLYTVSPPLDRACECLASFTKEPVETLSARLCRMTRYDLEQMARTLPLDTRRPTVAAVLQILGDHVAEQESDPTRLMEALSRDSADTHRAIQALCELYPPELWPAILLLPSDHTDTEWGLTAVRLLESLLAIEPGLPVALSLSAVEYDGVLRSHPDSRVATLLREGIVELRGVTGNQLEMQFRQAGVPSPSPAIVSRLTENGLTEDVANAFVAATHSLREPAPAEVASDFRSIHEEFLFGLLESMPRTAGLFRPNRSLGFRHGHQPAEGDLVAESLNLVVEVDGSHYHLNPEQYRRDRRKDWLYQRHGYLVLRFLAEDVVTDLERILDTILEAIELRRPIPSTGAP